MKNRGFTIVELLIVIVVIAILAAITIVAYNGIQDRAKMSRMQSDLTSLNKTIQLYRAANDSYPVSTSWRCSNSYPTDYIPGVAPAFISSLPADTGAGGSYCYRTNNGGVDYKIIRLNQPSIPVGEWALVSAAMKDTNTALVDRWGYWSTGGSGL